MTNACKKQFTLKQLSLVHDKPVIFVISQWQRELKPNIFYLVYRWLIALFLFVTCLVSVIDPKNLDQPASFHAKWLIYLTYWGLTICTLQTLVAAIILSCCTLALYVQSLPNLEEKALKFYKFYWVTNVIATDIAFSVTIIYWGMLYDDGISIDTMNILVHACNSIFMMLDLFLVRHPVRLLHCCYPNLFALCYAVFSAIYYAAGGTNQDGKVYIYGILDWTKPGTTLLVCLGVVGFLIVLHVLTWALYKLRKLLSDCILHRHTKSDTSITSGGSF